MAQKKSKGKTDKKDSNKNRLAKFSITKIVGVVVICLLIFFFLINNFMCNENGDVTYYNFKNYNHAHFLHTKPPATVLNTQDSSVGLDKGRRMRQNL